ncbi:MAG: helix-turn-helix transcriptional regulator [Clostridia bacterium]|nr:helix-turn-helix transcriptional regulator [Clostridia bacterium]
MQIKLSEQMRELRRKRGSTQDELAQALGVTPQAVSRWENGICYPDMELLPAMANYFGVSIDELFGYQTERSQRIDELAERIRSMNCLNNGKDVCMTECLQLARESAAEFPGNQTLMLCLASVLYNAGYVRYGEYHCTDADGYDVYAVEHHRTYDEWKEAIALYEKLLETLPDGSMRQQAVRELIQLYANTGEYDKGAAVAGTCPGLQNCRELLLASAYDGRQRAECLAEAVRTMISSAAEQMIQCLISLPHGRVPENAIRIIENAIGLLRCTYPDGDYGLLHYQIARMYLYLSEFRWRAGEHDAAFASLDKALDHARAFERCSDDTETFHTSPLFRTLKVNPEGYSLKCVSTLPEDWPWWCVPDFHEVKAEMQADPRWDEWVRKTKE